MRVLGCLHQGVRKGKQMVSYEQPFFTSERFRAALQPLATTERLPAGQEVFVCGETARGIFLISSGRVSLSVQDAREAKDAGPGSALGLPATIAKTKYMLTARVLDDAELAFVSREHFLQALDEQPELCLEVVQLLGSELQSTKRAILSRLAAAGSISIRKRPPLLGESGNRIGLPNARRLLAELKVEYDRLSRTSRSAILQQLRACAEVDSAHENAAEEGQRETTSKQH